MKRHLRGWRALWVSSRTAALATAALSALLYVAPRAEAGMVLGAIVDAKFVSQGPNGGSGVTVALKGDSPFNLSQGGAMDYHFISGANPDLSTFPNPFIGMNGLVDANGAFNTFCIEVTQNIGFGQTYAYTVSNLADAPQPAFGSTTPGPGMGSTAATEIAQLWAHYFPTINTSTDPGSTAAAFQLAIWKLEYDQAQLVGAASTLTAASETEAAAASLLFGANSSTNLTASGTSANAISILNASAGMVQWVEKNPHAVEQANLYALVSGGSNGAQDQIAQVPGTGGQQVPEPATAVMCLMGCICLGARRLRRAVGARA